MRLDCVPQIVDDRIFSISPLRSTAVTAAVDVGDEKEPAQTGTQQAQETTAPPRMTSIRAIKIGLNGLNKRVARKNIDLLVSGSHRLEDSF